MSEKYRKYFEKIETDVGQIYQFAEKARAIGIDPDTVVESPQARDAAGRVEKLVGPKGIADLLRTWKEEGADQDELCFRAMDWLIDDKLGTFTPDEKVDRAIRLSLAIKTEGVVSAPLEGIAKVVIRDNKLGGDPYLSLYFAGPIRAAGGTVQAFAVLSAEHVRQKMKIPKWVATEDEIGRFVEEVKLYDRIMNLQYPSTNEELAFAVKHLTVELNGDRTEQREVSAHRDLPRIETNFVRGGPCLVLNDGVLLKAKKILRVIEKRKIPEWEWLIKLKKLGQAENDEKPEENGKDKALDYGGDTYKGKKTREENDLGGKEENRLSRSPSKIRRHQLDEKNPPLNKYIADVIAGRPVFAYPSQVGGHRIRYGRSRNTGLAACGTHPSQMILLDKFMAIGTQIRIERPGKSSSTMPVTSIEPPIVLLKNGDVKQLWDAKDADKIQENRLAEKILFLGDILFGYGEFVENNHTVIPSGYVE
ncbi:MAG: DNA-directed DNA polymerase II large subunit, partial [Promethearchaeota archaeon]